jgi:hypothetical protein
VQYLTNEQIDEYVFNVLVELGYAPTEEEVQDITDIFIGLLFELELIREEDQNDGGNKQHPRSF